MSKETGGALDIRRLQQFTPNYQWLAKAVAVAALVLSGARDPEQLGVREDGTGYVKPEGDLPPRDKITARQAEAEAVAIVQFRVLHVVVEVSRSLRWHS